MTTSTTTMRARQPMPQPSLPIWQTSRMDNDLDHTLDAVGPRLRALRRGRETTLADLSEATGISVSTLSRLESGSRRPTLELLLPLARAHGVTLDELDGGLRLVLGEHDLVLSPGEGAEFDPRVPPWFGTAGAEPVEFLSLFG